MTPDQDLRTLFNQAARDYDAARPEYPEQLFVDLIQLSEIPQGGRALEIGCGTGQATLPMARLGYDILCLDIGPDLLAIAANKCRDYLNVHFEHVAFENWPLRAGEYDLVYAATSFHWIPRETGYPKTVSALKPGGTLAIFSNANPRPVSGFLEDVQSVYRQHVPGSAVPRQRQSIEADIQGQAECMRVTGLFSSVEVRTYPWTKTYTTAQYLQLLNTYSDHLAMEEERRYGLYQAIGELIEKSYGGKVEKPYLSELFLGKSKK